MKASIQGGRLVDIQDCYLIVPDNRGNDYRIVLNNLPSITDSKSAGYNEENIMGRATGLLTYRSSDTRAISFDITLMATSTEHLGKNIQILRALQATTYPQAPNSSVPFVPPPVCRMRCGWMLADVDELCVVCEKVSVKFDTDVPFDSDLLFPYKFTISTSWKVVYRSDDLPGQERIFYRGV